MNTKINKEEKSVNICDKIEVSALQLLYIISDAIDEFCSERYSSDNQINSLGFVQDKVVEIFKKNTSK